MDKFLLVVGSVCISTGLGILLGPSGLLIGVGLGTWALLALFLWETKNDVR